jgi:mercuric reductase
MALDFAALIDQKDQVIKDFRDKKYQSIVTDSEPIHVFKGEARFTAPSEVSVGRHVLSAPSFLVATGSSPLIPDLPGLAETPYLTSDLLTSDAGLELTALPESVVIIGGGYIALELGQMFSRFGSRVTILERRTRLLSAYEPEISDSIADVLRQEGITIYTNARVTRVRGNDTEVVIAVDVSDRQKELKAAKLLIAVGRKPNTERLGLDIPMWKSMSAGS